MTEIMSPVLIIGIGRVGAILAEQAKKILNTECLIISNEETDFQSDCQRIKISTNPIINPSVHLLRGFAAKESAKIKEYMDSFESIILITNLASKSGSAIAPIISNLARNKTLVSFTIMPFKYEKERIFDAGVSLKRIKNDSKFTVIIDNDAVLETNPDITPAQCYNITNSALLHVITILKENEIPQQTSIISTSKNEKDIELALRDSLKMLYNNTSPDKVKRSIIYVSGGNNVPIGIINSIRNLTRECMQDVERLDVTTSKAEESKVIMLSAIQGETKFDRYDPLGIIPKEKTLDWDEPDYNMNCNLELYQLE